MRGPDARPLFFWLGIFVLTVLLAGLAGGSMALPGETVATPTATARATPTPSPTTSRLLADARGFVALGGTASSAELRRETAGNAVASLRGQGFIGAVSGTGRRVAYWVTTGGATRELRVFDTTAPDQDTSLATVPEIDRGAAAVWSSDRTGLLVVVESSGRGGSGASPEPFSALRIIDTPTRSIHEIARLTDGSQFWPIGWDRVSQQAGACVYTTDGSAIAWAAVGENAVNQRTPMDPGIPAATVRGDGNAVLGVQNGSVIRVWSIASYMDHVELGASPGERIAFARWKPGGAEVVVLVAGRLEVWPAAGGEHRVVARGLPDASDLLVSADGELAFVVRDDGGSVTAIDLANGATGAVPMTRSRLLVAVSFR